MNSGTASPTNSPTSSPLVTCVGDIIDTTPDPSCQIIDGDIQMTSAFANTDFTGFENVIGVTGELLVDSNLNLLTTNGLDNVRYIDLGIDIKDSHNLQEVKFISMETIGSFDVSQALHTDVKQIYMPNLNTIDGNININTISNITMISLENIYGSLTYSVGEYEVAVPVNENFDFRNLITMTGSLSLYITNTFYYFNKLESINNLILNDIDYIEIPNLIEVSTLNFNGCSFNTENIFNSLISATTITISSHNSNIFTGFNKLTSATSISMSRCDFETFDAFNNLTSLSNRLTFLYLEEIISMNGFNNLITIGNNLYIGYNSAAIPTILLSLETVNGDVDIVYNDYSFFELPNLTYIDKELLINRNNLMSQMRMDELTYVGENIRIIYCEILTNITYDKLEYVGDYFRVLDNQNAEIVSFKNLRYMNSTATTEPFSIANINAAETFDFPKLVYIGNDIVINNNDILLNLNFNNLQIINIDMTITNNAALQTLNGLENINHVGNNINVNSNPSLTNVDAILDINYIGGYADIRYQGGTIVPTATPI